MLPQQAPSPTAAATVSHASSSTRQEILKLFNALRFLGLQDCLPFLEHSRFTTAGSILAIKDEDLRELGMAYELRALFLSSLGKKVGSPPPPNATYQGPSSEEQSSPSCSPLSEIVTRPSYDEPSDQGKPRRKYMTRPKPDSLAPKRPPNAFTLFANSIRKELMQQGYTFSDISRIAADRWGGRDMVKLRLSIERRAAAMLNDYHQKKSIYQKSAEYKEYQDYLATFERDPKAILKRQKTCSGPKSSSTSVSVSHADNSETFVDPYHHHHVRVTPYPSPDGNDIVYTHHQQYFPNAYYSDHYPEHYAEHYPDHYSEHYPDHYHRHYTDPSQGSPMLSNSCHDLYQPNRAEFVSPDLNNGWSGRNMSGQYPY